MQTFCCLVFPLFLRDSDNEEKDFGETSRCFSKSVLSFYTKMFLWEKKLVI